MDLELTNKYLKLIAKLNSELKMLQLENKFLYKENEGLMRFIKNNNGIL